MKTGILHFDELPEPLSTIGMPNDIPITEGQHEKELQVDYSRLPEDVIGRMRAYYKKSQPDARQDWPAGFSEWAAIRRGGSIIWDKKPEV